MAAATPAPAPAIAAPRSGNVVRPPRYALVHALVQSLGEPLVSANRIEWLPQGAQVWSLVFDAIERAERHVNLALPEDVSPPFAAALGQRLLARCGEGIQVNLLMGGAQPCAEGDWHLLRDSGMTIGRPRLGADPRRARRHHAADGSPREDCLMVIDGRSALLGALAPARHDPGGRACGGLRIGGPAVALLQRRFIERWSRRCTNGMQPARYFPALRPQGSQRVALTGAAEPRAPCTALRRALLAGIEAAQHSVLLASTRATPEPAVLDALARAAARGVELRLLLPPRLHPAAAAARWQAAGVRLHPAAALAARVDACVIDGTCSAVGRDVLDNDDAAREEAALLVLDESFGSALAARLRHAMGNELPRNRAAHHRAACAPTDGGAWARGLAWLAERWTMRW